MNVRWLARVAASSAVRKLVYLAIAAIMALVLSFVPTGKAHAQDVDDAACMSAALQGNLSSPSPLCSTRQIAYENTGNFLRANRPTWDGVIDGPVCNVSGGRYCRYKTDHGGSYIDVRWFDTQNECPAGHVWNDELKECAPSACAEAPDYGGAMAKSFNMCSNGCRYEQAATGGVSACLGTGEDMTCFADNWKPTGGACKPNDKPPSPFDSQQETCRTVPGVTGSHQECIKPDGKHCVTSAKGAVLCWKPSEMGPRMTTDGTVGGDREEAPATPEPPPNMENPTVSTTTTTTIGGKTYNTSIYTGTGNTGGQGNVGEGGKNTGGTGDPKGEGEGGEGDGEGDGPGEAGGTTGDMYEASGKSLESVWNTFKSQVEASPFVAASTSFLTVTVTASCPTFSVPETAFWAAMEFSYHCTGPLADALALGAYLLLAIAAYTAFKIGFG